MILCLFMYCSCNGSNKLCDLSNTYLALVYIKLYIQHWYIYIGITTSTWQVCIRLTVFVMKSFQRQHSAYDKDIFVVELSLCLYLLFSSVREFWCTQPLCLRRVGWGGGGVHCNIDDYRDMVQAFTRRYRDWGLGGDNRLVLVYQNK